MAKGPFTLRDRVKKCDVESYKVLNKHFTSVLVELAVVKKKYRLRIWLIDSVNRP